MLLERFNSLIIKDTTSSKTRISTVLLFAKYKPKEEIKNEVKLR